MNFRERRQWLRQHAATLTLGGISLLSSFNAAVSTDRSEEAAKKLHDAELTQRYQNPAARVDHVQPQPQTIAQSGPTPEIKNLEAAARKARDQAKDMEEKRNGGLESVQESLTEADRQRRPPRKRGR